MAAFPHASCRWFSTYCIQQVVWRASRRMDSCCDAYPLLGIICGRKGNRVFLLWQTRQCCHDANLGAMENKLRRGTQGK
ncbi:hypothetical protein M419DRAFT_124227 [Trichoderma reesei RUT C-30]|uniref:Uncharacterized protein n=1 Tax=Hypocrea jecorina (strain ATCC 56765 / BCRC 32924 / NRRL 11460 / Rut C-30) TaxID=1344414 RepID=A0A024S703_HYPJR|nr:hypothetical protein M419DRAFT_124227 [Trichoderma reesei RUT C-30]